MQLEVLGMAVDIELEVDGFEPSYHAHFAEVRRSAITYIAEGPGSPAADVLGHALPRVLRLWGAGLRAAPGVRSPDETGEALRDAGFHADLAALASLGLRSFGLDGERRLLGGSNDPQKIELTGEALLRVLRHFGEHLLRRNTCLTYPTKLLMLMTGLTPALDGRVRAGLRRASVAGYAAVQRMPESVDDAEFRNLYALLFLLGDCWARHEALLTQGLARSEEGRRIDSLDSPGRVFDVLLFNKRCYLLRGWGCERGWQRRLV